MRYKKIVAAAALLFSAVAYAQDFTPAYSTDRLHKLADAIANAEGFHQKGTIPARKHNPGDLKHNGQYRVFKTDADGWAALHAQLVRVIIGQSKVYCLRMTLQQVGAIYAGTPLWAKNVSKRLGVPGTTTLGQYLTNGDLDVPPQLVLAQQLHF